LKLEVHPAVVEAPSRNWHDGSGHRRSGIYRQPHGLGAAGCRRGQVIVVDRLSTGFDWAVAPEAKLIQADVSDTAHVADIIKTHGIDSIIHFAGSISVPESLADPMALLPEQHGQFVGTDPAAVETGVKQLRLFLNSRGLRHAGER
jgi:nucleoside-diphosphate-sugar epimerase